MKTTLWRWDDAPVEYKRQSMHGGDEYLVALVEDMPGDVDHTARRSMDNEWWLPYPLDLNDGYSDQITQLSATSALVIIAD